MIHVGLGCGQLREKSSDVVVRTTRRFMVVLTIDEGDERVRGMTPGSLTQAIEDIPGVRVSSIWGEQGKVRIGS